MFFTLIYKIAEIKKTKEYITDNLINLFIIAKILRKEKKKIPINRINEFYSFLLTTIEGLPVNKSDALFVFSKYFSSISHKKVPSSPSKKVKKNISVYINYLENEETYIHAFILYVLGLSMKMSRFNANILSKFGMHYGVLLLIKEELGNESSNIFKLKPFMEMDYLDKLHLIGGKLDRYFKVADSELEKMTNKDIKVSLLYELTDLLGEVYNIITKEF